MEQTFEDLGVRILTCRYDRLRQWNLPNLSAPYWRLYRNAGAGAGIVLGGREIPLTPRAFVCIPPDTPYASVLHRPVRHFYLHFVTRASYRLPRDRVYRIPSSPLLVRAVEEIDSHLVRPDGSPLRVTTLSLLLAHAALGQVPPEALRMGYADARVVEAVAYMRRRLEAKVSNAELAARANMHPNAFCRLFRQTTGRTPQAYLAQARIEAACMMLHCTTKTIDRIAQETGFCDRYHFSRWFKRLRGLGPATFRRTRTPGL
ncbi:MAG TPA: hypothetical protein DCX07_15520 [Phycisphaerales bacterium]|nr:hypothetical protein [Phycisphaerales bacterium]